MNHLLPLTHQFTISLIPTCNRYTTPGGHAGLIRCSQQASMKKGIVITGGTKGLGFCLAQRFLEAGERVVLCGRNEGRVDSATAALVSQYGDKQVHGFVCDVSRPEEVERFASFAQDMLGPIHIWINNAGEVTSKQLLANVDADEIVRATGTNVLGSLLCCRAAMKLMMAQPPSPVPLYHVFNMGFSQWGAKFTKSACTHKATKVALTQLTESLKEELRNAGISSIGVHNLSPGMVLTDLLLKDSTPLARRFFNVLAEEPETVAAALVPELQRVQGSGTSIAYLSPLSAIVKVILGFPQIIYGGRFFDKNGDRVELESAAFQANGVKILY